MCWLIFTRLLASSSEMSLKAGLSSLWVAKEGGQSAEAYLLAAVKALFVRRKLHQFSDRLEVLLLLCPRRRHGGRIRSDSDDVARWKTPGVLQSASHLRQKEARRSVAGRWEVGDQKGPTSMHFHLHQRRYRD